MSQIDDVTIPMIVHKHDAGLILILSMNNYWSCINACDGDLRNSDNFNKAMMWKQFTDKFKKRLKSLAERQRDARILGKPKAVKKVAVRLKVSQWTFLYNELKHAIAHGGLGQFFIELDQLLLNLNDSFQNTISNID